MRGWGRRLGLCLILSLLLVAPAYAQTLNLWVHSYVTADDLYKELLEEFERETGIRVRFESVPAPDFEQKLFTAMAGGAGPDLFRMPSWSTPAYVRRGLVEPINARALGYSNDDELLNAYIPGTLDAFMVNGRLYALPFEINTMGLFYRKDLFQEVGLDPQSPPATWDETWQAAEKITQRDGSGRLTRVGFEWPWNNPIWYMHTFSPILYQAGGSLLSPDGRASAVNSPAGLVALTIYDAPVHQYDAADPGFRIQDDFQQGRVGMMFSGPFFPATVERDYPALQAQVDYDVAAYPQINPDDPITHLWSLGWAVNPRSRNKEAAWKLLKFLADRPEVWLKRAGYIQPRKDLVASDTAKGLWFFDLFWEGMAHGRYPAQSAQFEQIQAALRNAVERTLIEGVAPQQSLEQLERDINNAL